MKNTIIIIALLICGCGGVKLEQEVEIGSYVNCKYRIETNIWVRDWDGLPITLEYYKYVYCNYSQIDSVKQAERNKAEKLLPKIIECYERGCPDTP